ncbi:P-loop NTPase fold protein [Streptomyces sp. NPDC046197]|uniref:P-loop NTPase fold protein n=1 Tax=Streptomyces sp. NPDC046197 TaxID=3154337 RepID=UPI0033C15EDD
MRDDFHALPPRGAQGGLPDESSVERQHRPAVRCQGWLIAELNPWLYSDLESLTLALFSEIREALPKDERWSEARQKIGGFGQAISPLGKITALFGLDSEGLLQEVSNRISGDTSASAAKHKAEEALRKAGRPVLVVMDDLDARPGWGRRARRCRHSSAGRR